MYRIGKISQRARKAAFGAILGLVGAFILLFSGGCGICKSIGGGSEHTEVHVRDSVVYNIIDSTIIHEATHYKDMAWLGDSLKIEGTRSRMWAYADTTREALIGGLEEDKVEEKQKIIYKDRIQYRDSIQIKEVPVPVEVEKKVVPTWSWWSLIFNILGVCGLVVFIVLKIKLH